LNKQKLKTYKLLQHFPFNRLPIKKNLNALLGIICFISAIDTYVNVLRQNAMEKRGNLKPLVSFVASGSRFYIEP
jgi:hypothetical protein